MKAMKQPFTHQVKQNNFLQRLCILLLNVSYMLYRPNIFQDFFAL